MIVFHLESTTKMGRRISGYVVTHAISSIISSAQVLAGVQHVRMNSSAASAVCKIFNCYFSFLLFRDYNQCPQLFKIDSDSHADI